jgi:hypothetical protein
LALHNRDEPITILLTGSSPELIHQAGTSCRCDIRNLSKSAVVVALLALLDRLKERPPTLDLVVVTGSDKAKVNSLAVFVWRCPTLMSGFSL